MPASRRPLVSVCMDSRSPMHSSWCSAAASRHAPWRSHARVEGPLASRLHGLEVADAQHVVLGLGPDDAADEPVALRVRSERPSTIAAAPEPRVSVANCASTSSRVASGRASRARVTSWVCRAPSPSTISA